MEKHRDRTPCQRSVLCADEERYSECVINVKPDGELVFEFVWRGERYTYEGREQQEVAGKYVLKCAKAGGSIDLYRLPDGEGFMGRYIERGSFGLWSIEIAD